MRLSDCTCTICLNILIEPVTLPCDHELCMPCFRQHVSETSLYCPLCRTRLSVWARRAARQNKLINETRWKEIREAFPEHVQNRLDGKEDDGEYSDDEFFFPNIAEPGELRREYEEERSKVQEERAESNRRAEEASLRLIAELEAQEAVRREQEQKDLELAAAISKELNGVTPQICQDNAAVNRTGVSVTATPKAPPRTAASHANGTPGSHGNNRTQPGTVQPHTSSPRTLGTKATPQHRTKPAGIRPSASSPRASSTKTTATKGSSQGHLQMWYRPKPKQDTTAASSPSDLASAVVRTTLLSPQAVEERIKAVRSGQDPSSIHRADKRRWSEDEQGESGISAGTSTSATATLKIDWSRKRLCLSDVSNNTKA